MMTYIKNNLEYIFYREQLFFVRPCYAPLKPIFIRKLNYYPTGKVFYN